MANHLFFYAALSLTLVHEMDAIRCREWSILPGLSLLKMKQLTSYTCWLIFRCISYYS